MEFKFSWGIYSEYKCKNLSFSTTCLFHLGPRTQTSGSKGMKKVQTHQKVYLSSLIKIYLLICTWTRGRLFHASEPLPGNALPFPRDWEFEVLDIFVPVIKTYLLRISLIPCSFLPLEILKVVNYSENLSCNFSF